MRQVGEKSSSGRISPLKMLLKVSKQLNNVPFRPLQVEFVEAYFRQLEPLVMPHLLEMHFLLDD